MHSSRWETVKEIFWEASELPAAERDQFIREKCSGNAELLDELRSLLLAHEDSDKVIENGLSFDSIIGGSQDYTGKEFGSYKIIREIGRGGMGAVFLANRSDGEFQQTVALKIVRQTVPDAETAKRFRREREILASLNHPNIAQLYDGGVSEAGEPFFAMEYVEGDPLLDYARKGRLTFEQKLQLFLKVCSAVDFAHRNLTVHRDIKPSNIIVSKSGEPKLLDFGLAKILDENFEDQDQTATQFRAFTIAYASPEQMRGEKVTTSSDIYSLGVLLYEVLTGSKPFDLDGKNLYEVLQTVAGQEPRLPSRVTSSVSGSTELRGDLDNILLTSLRKEPERRYHSVEAFAEDIRRYLDKRPILARPNTVAYRAAKFLSRNKVAVGAVALVVLALVTGLIGSLWEARIARIERDRAEKHFQDVRQLSNSLLFELSPKIERLPGSTEAREILVNRALEYLDNLASESQGDAQLQSELASAYEKIGDLEGNPTNPNLIDFAAAIASYEKAGKIRQVLSDADPNDVEALRKLAENHRVLGNITHQTNDIDTSDKYMASAMSMYEKLGAGSSAPTAQLDLAKVNYDFGLNLQAAKSYENSLKYFDAAEAILSKLNDNSPGDVDVLKMAGEIKAQNSMALSWAKRQVEAEKEMDEAIGIFEPLFRANPNDTSIRSSMWLTYWLASGIYQDQNEKKAYDYAKKALKVVQESAGKDDSNIRAKQQLAKSYSTLGETATALGRLDEAMEYLELACVMQKQITETTTKNDRLRSDLALSLTRLAGAKTARGFLRDALADISEAEELYLNVIATSPSDRRSNRNLAQAYEQMAKTYERLQLRSHSPNEKDLARANYQKALDIYLRLDSQNALTEYDRKTLGELQAAVR